MIVAEFVDRCSQPKYLPKLSGVPASEVLYERLDPPSIEEAGAHSLRDHARVEAEQLLEHVEGVLTQVRREPIGRLVNTSRRAQRQLRHP